MKRSTGSNALVVVSSVSKMPMWTHTQKKKNPCGSEEEKMREDENRWVIFY